MLSNKIIDETMEQIALQQNECYLKYYAMGKAEVYYALLRFFEVLELKNAEVTREDMVDTLNVMIGHDVDKELINSIITNFKEDESSKDYLEKPIENSLEN